MTTVVMLLFVNKIALSLRLILTSGLQSCKKGITFIQISDFYFSFFFLQLLNGFDQTNVIIRQK